MKVHLDCPPGLGQGIHRVVRELKARTPAGVEVVDTLDAADHVIFHVVGVQNFSAERIDVSTASVVASGRGYSIVQYCLRTSEASDPEWWEPIWQEARAVWSYYDLPALLDAEIPGFYHAPLGASAAFREACGPPAERPFLVGTSGYIAETEGVDAWTDVCHAAKGMQFHLGPWLRCFEGATVICGKDLTDAELAQEWRRCRFVNGLRAIEGFELPAAEGLCCGARPVLYARDEHWRWFEGHAVYLVESEPLRPQIEALVRAEIDPVTDEERAWARDRFDWARLCRGFWDRITQETR